MLKPCIFYFMRGGSVDSFEKAKKYEIQCQSFDTGDDVEGWRFWRQLFESIEKGWECDPYARCHIRHRASPMSSNSQIYFFRKSQISPRCKRLQRLFQKLKNLKMKTVEQIKRVCTICLKRKASMGNTEKHFEAQKTQSRDHNIGRFGKMRKYHKSRKADGHKNAIFLLCQNCCLRSQGFTDTDTKGFVRKLLEAIVELFGNYLFERQVSNICWLNIVESILTYLQQDAKGSRQ